MYVCRLAGYSRRSCLFTLTALTIISQQAPHARHPHATTSGERSVIDYDKKFGDPIPFSHGFLRPDESLRQRLGV